MGGEDKTEPGFLRDRVVATGFFAMMVAIAIVVTIGELKSWQAKAEFMLGCAKTSRTAGECVQLWGAR